MGMGVELLGAGLVLLVVAVIVIAGRAVERGERWQ